MKSWILIGSVMIALLVIIAWIEPELGVFIAFAILPYLIAHFIVREDYIHSIKGHVSERQVSHHTTPLLLV